MSYTSCDSVLRPLVPAPSATRRRVSSALVAALAAGVGLWLAPSEADAAPRCTSKPAVCARIANERKARQEPAPVAYTRAAPVAAARNTLARCNSKPIVCARLDALGGGRAPQPPVTLASNASGDRCTSKPAVCARLRLKPKSAPMTLASGELP